MSTLNKGRISNSISNQLNLENQIIITAINSIVNSANLNGYENLKLLSKTIKDYLKSNSIEFKHSQVLNVISKSLGFQNHHSLKAYFDNPVEDNIEIDIHNDSALKKLFYFRKEFMEKFDIEESHFSHDINKGHEFKFIYDKRAMKLRSKEKQEINKYLREKGIKPYKSIILLCKIKYDDLRRIAFNILQHYQSFFKPIWFEQDDFLNNPIAVRNDWWMSSYSNIEYKSESYLLVDSFSTDLPWHIIINFLNYTFYHGTIEDIEFFEECLKQKTYTREKRTTKTLGEASRIYDWEKEQILSSIVKNKKNSVKDTLNDTSYRIDIQKYMLKHLKEFENKNNKSMKEIIIENCDYFYGQNNYKDKNIKEKLFSDLLQVKRDNYIDKMEDIEDIEVYRTYHDKYNCIEMLSSKIQSFIKMYKDVEKNYTNYLVKFRKKGYL